MTHKPIKRLTEDVRIIKQRRLEHLEEQAAIYGINVPAEIANEIEDLQSELELVVMIQRPSIDPQLRAIVAKSDYADLLGKFIGDHARRLTSIETWQSKRDERIDADDRLRQSRQHKLDLILGALIFASVISSIFNIVVLIILLSR